MRSGIPDTRSRPPHAWFAAAASAALLPAWALCAQPEWIEQIGTTANDEAFAGMPDGNGGLIGTGLTGGSLGAPNLGGFDVPVYIIDGCGGVIGPYQFGTPTHESAHAIVPGSGGDVIIGGGTAGSLGGPSAGGFDAFITRMNPATGARSWTTQFGTTGIDDLSALAPDGQGGVFAVGVTTGSFGGPNSGGFDGFFVHVESDGQLVLADQFGTLFDDEGNAIVFNGSDVLIGGSTRGSLQGLNLGGQDAFVLAFDSVSGQRLWTDQFGTAQADRITAMLGDGVGGAFFTGVTNGSLAGPNQGGTDIIVGRYDNTGNRTWTRQLGTSADDEAFAIAPSGNGGFIIGGATRGSLGGPNQGGWDAFIICFDPTGEPDFAHQIGSTGDDVIHGLAPDGNGVTLVTGTTTGSLGGPNAGGADIFVAKFDDSCPCACDFDTSTGVGVCDIVDFVTFAGLFAGGDPCACDIDTSTGPDVCDIIDFVTFAGQFAAGCP